MSHEIRRRDRALGTEEAYAILAKGDHGVLATWGEDGYPYAVPINHVLDGEVLYLHCAQAGHKLENLQHCDKVSYCVVTEAEVLPRELATQYESAVAFGRARRVEDPDEKYRALVALLQRFAPEHMAHGMEELRTSFERTAVLRIDLERVTGKARKKNAKGD
jgi:nitroimidazol reductase NimA-like FMN-containing flavoprotein (pyridoxamine 5'-phosphate oxidase superfamily)